ncbi:MAG: hypothetical protein INR70_09270 [Parafilimonas terrae]|nr:hypothetical protein [Parafilimonas terrae]
MVWLRLTQANTGMTIHVNMAQIVVIAPSKTGGSILMSTAQEKESVRLIPVRETPQDVASLLERAGVASA